MPQEQFFCTSCKGRKRLDAHGKPSLMKGPTTKTCPLCEGIGYLRDKEKIEIKIIDQPKLEELSPEQSEEVKDIEIKKRGRPAKIKQQELPKKKRGRPPKQ